MRFLLLGWMMAIPCAVVIGQEITRLPPTAMPRPVMPPPAMPAMPFGGQADYRPGLPAAAPSYARLEHLLKAAAHLEAAGLQDDAAKVWQQAEQESKFVKQEIESLRAELARLRRAAGDTRQVLIRVEAIEVPAGKLRRYGIGPYGNVLASDGGRASTWAINAVSPDNALFGALDALRKANLVKTLARPTLVTVSGRMASFRAGSVVPAPVAGSGKVSVGPTTGIEIDFLPQIYSNGRLRSNCTRSSPPWIQGASATPRTRPARA